MMIVISMLWVLGLFLVNKQYVALFCPPVVFVMAWGKLSQQFPKGIPNRSTDFMPSLEGTEELLVRKPTCPDRFNGIHVKRHFTGGFFLFSSLRFSPRQSVVLSS